MIKLVHKRALSLLLSAVLVLTLLPVTALAVTEQDSSVTITQDEAVSDIETAINDALGTDGIDTVTVTGSKTDVGGTLTLNIPENKAVVWKATYQADSTFCGTLITLPDDGGTFEVAADGTDSGEIRADVASSNGMWSTAIDATGATTVTVSGGTVSADGGIAIEADASSTVTVSGGTVSTTTGCAIYAEGDVTVSSGIVSATGEGGDAIVANGSVTVSGGTVSAAGDNGTAIDATGATTVTVSGGAVHADGNHGTAIVAKGDVTVSNSGAVSADGSTNKDGSWSTAIHAEGDVTVNGGTVHADGKFGQAIFAEGDVTVSNGTVSANGSTKEDSNWSIAINAEDDSSTVTVSGGAVSATTGCAICSVGTASSTVTVSGGAVFAYGSAITGENNVIYTPNNLLDFTGVTDTGVVIAWDQGANRSTYTVGQAVDLTVSPTGAAAWALSNGSAGISYANGENTGFFPVNGVTVVPLPEYVAMGDSIATGYGLDGYVPAGGNGTPETLPKDAYAAIVGKTLDLQTALMAYDGLTSSALSTMLTTYISDTSDTNVLAQLKAYLSETKVITLSIGSDDILQPFLSVVAKQLGCDADEIQTKLATLSTVELATALAALNTDGVLKENQTIKSAAAGFANNFTNIISDLKTLAPDAKIYVTNAYNPYEGISISYGTGTLALGDIAESYITTLNEAFSADSEDYTLIDVHKAFSDSLNNDKKSLVNAKLSNFNFDPHPNADGHDKIARLILVAAAPHPTWPSGSALTVSGITSAGATLSWPAASGGITATGYQLYRNGTLIATLDGNTLIYTVTGLSASTGYSFQVQAAGANGVWTTDGPAATVTTKASGTSGSPSTGSSSSTTSTTTVSGNTATTTVTPTVSGGRATASVSASQMSDALKQAQTAAGTSGTPGVQIQVGGASGAGSVAATIPNASMQSLVSGGVGGLTVSSNLGSVTFGADALKTIVGAGSGDVTVSVAKADTSALSDAAKQAIGDHPVYQFSVTNGTTTVSQFGGTVTASVPYTLAAGEDPNAIVLYYINASGGLETVTNGHYDASTGTVVFETGHFSTYAVGYNKVSFTDVSSAAWYHDAVTFLSARSITSGATATTFGPDATLTRGQFITMLLRACGVAAVTNPTDNFTDAGNTYYTGYLAAAKSLGITSGVGDNKFAPAKAITRQEMFTLLYNALKALDKLPSGTSGKTLSDFTDSGSISSYAQDAVAKLVGTGVVNGNGGKLNPTGTTTRAEMAQVFYNLLGE